MAGEIVEREHEATLSNQLASKLSTLRKEVASATDEYYSRFKQLRERQDLLAKDIGSALNYAGEIKEELIKYKATAEGLSRATALEVFNVTSLTLIASSM